MGLSSTDTVLLIVGILLFIAILVFIYYWWKHSHPLRIDTTMTRKKYGKLLNPTKSVYRHDWMESY